MQKNVTFIRNALNIQINVLGITITGYYHGPAENSCNLQHCINPLKVKIPCIIHNFRSYDAHLILSAVKPRHGKISVIPNNAEK